MKNVTRILIQVMKVIFKGINYKVYIKVRYVVTNKPFSFLFHTDTESLNPLPAFSDDLKTFLNGTKCNNIKFILGILKTKLMLDTWIYIYYPYKHKM